MTALVVDASVVIKWVVIEKDSEQAQQLRRRCRLVAPELVVAEVADLLWKKIRLGEFSLSEAQEAAGFIRETGIEIRPMLGLLGDAIRLADRIRHPAYDCIYLALALATGIRFVTADERFLGKLRDLGDAHLVQACVSLADWREEM